MTGKARWRLLQPWAGLCLAILGAGIGHQFGGEGLFDDCQRIGAGPLQLVVPLCILVVLAGGWLSLPIVRRSEESGARRVIAGVSVGVAVLAAFATILPVIASLTLPPCFQ